MSEQEYKEFYKHVALGRPARDHRDEAEGTFEVPGLLFIRLMPRSIW